MTLMTLMTHGKLFFTKTDNLTIKKLVVRFIFIPLRPLCKLAGKLIINLCPKKKALNLLTS